MRKLNTLYLFVLVLSLFLSCSERNSQNHSDLSTIYGPADERQDVYLVDDLLDLPEEMFSSVGMLIDVKHIKPDSKFDMIEIESESFQDDKNLCDNDSVFYRGKLFSQQFLDQPNPGYCSGFYVGNGLFVTAGHCLNGQTTTPNPIDVMRKINNTRVVFGYHLGSNGEIPIQIPKANIFRIEVKAKQHSWGGLDYAVLQLVPAYRGFDSLSQRPALEFRADAQTNREVALVGFPAGLPMKFAPGKIIKNGDERFSIDADGFPGNSGSPIFDLKTKKIVGIYVSSVDYNYDYPGLQPDGSIPSCQVLFYCQGSIGNCYGKEAMKTREIVDVIDSL